MRDLTLMPTLVIQPHGALVPHQLPDSLHLSYITRARVQTEMKRVKGF